MADLHIPISRTVDDETVQMLGCAVHVPRKDDFRYSYQYLPEEKYFTLEDFNVSTECIGAGKLGKVYRAKHKASRHMLALKQMNKEEILTEDIKYQIQREIEIHSRLQHPNIINMYGYFQDEANLYIALEFAKHGSLYESVHNEMNRRFAEAKAAPIISQVLKAIEYLHRLNIIHRDLKPENILLAGVGSNTTVKVADLGWAVVMRHDSTRTTMCGTTEYLPTELAKLESYGFGYDMWTIGVLTFELLVGSSPFYDAGGDDAVLDKIISGSYDFPSVVSGEARDFIGKLLVKEEDRMSPTTALKHPWIVKHCGAYVPQPEVERITVPCVAPWKEFQCFHVSAARGYADDAENKPVVAEKTPAKTVLPGVRKAFATLNTADV